MAYRFVSSKYKNTTPKLPKKEDQIFDAPIGALSCTNNGIQASSQYLAFHIEGEGGKLGVLPVGARGRRTRNDIGIVCAHSELLNDFALLPFAPDTMITCCRDEKMKLWKLSGETNVEQIGDVDVGLGVSVECLATHPTASGIVAAGSTSSVFVSDLTTCKVAIELEGVLDKTQSMSWSPDGKLLAVSIDKGRQVLVYDVRASGQAIQTLEMHGGMGRESRVLFCGDRLLSTGFTNKRVQEVRILDSNKWGAPIHIQEYVSTTGVLIPHYDEDTKLVFLTGKGTNKLFLAEMQNKAPQLSPVFEMTLPEQCLGACIGSKLSVNVMDGEVATYFQLTKHSIVPIPCIVPRRSYRDFHSDLFPETAGKIAGGTAAEWLSGGDFMPAKISLSPASSTMTSPSATSSASTPSVAPSVALSTATPPSASTPAVPSALTPMYDNSAASSASSSSSVSARTSPENHKQQFPEEPAEIAPTSAMTKAEPKELDYGNALRKAEEKENSGSRDNGESLAEEKRKETPEPDKVPLRQMTQIVEPVKFRSSGNVAPLRTRVRPKSCVVGVVASKFRHVETVTGGKAGGGFSNLRNVNTRMAPESTGCATCTKYVAVALAGPAGVVAIYAVENPVRVPDGVMDGLYNKANVSDLSWNPFDDSQLAVGTDCGLLHLWTIPEGTGLEGAPALNELEPAKVLNMNGEKIITMKWHPLARGLLAVALGDNSIELWDTERCERTLRIVSHTRPVSSLAWSAGGRKLVSIGKDQMLNVHRPQLGVDCLILQKKNATENARPARVIFACDDRVVVLVSLTRSSGRQIQLFDSSDLTTKYTQMLDSGTQPLIPIYDYDSNVIFLFGKGDRTVIMFEVCFDSPYLLPLTSYTFPTGGQSMTFHNKKKCNVMAVEFQRGWILSEKTLEPLIFRVPRIKKDVFQSDLFPDALVTWRPVMTSAEWMAGDERPPAFESLRPDGVGALVAGNPVACVNGQNNGVQLSSKAITVPTVAPQTLRKSDIPEDPVREAIQEPTENAPTLKVAQAPPKLLTMTEEAKMVEKAWSAKIEMDGTLEQDLMQGVDPDEWN